MDSTTAVEPFCRDGAGPRGRVGVLLCHGFTGSPQSLRPWAEYLADEGYTVRLPLLPGHGTRWQDLNRTGFADWLAAATTALAELRSRCDAVVVCGLSMGGTLTLRLAELHPDLIDAIVLVNPSILTTDWRMRALPFIKYLRGSLQGIASDIADPDVSEDGYDRTPLKAADSLRRAWKLVRADLGLIRMPVLLLHSATDHVVDPLNSQVLLDSISSSDVTEIVLPHSYHVATLDYDAHTILAESAAFIARVTGAEAPASVADDDAALNGSAALSDVVVHDGILPGDAGMSRNVTATEVISQ